MLYCSFQEVNEAIAESFQISETDKLLEKIEEFVKGHKEFSEDCLAKFLDQNDKIMRALEVKEKNEWILVSKKGEEEEAKIESSDLNSELSVSGQKVNFNYLKKSEKKKGLGKSQITPESKDLKTMQQTEALIIEEEEGEVSIDK